MSGNVAPTRQNLLRIRRRLDRVARGRDLLRRKREALVAELFRLARPAADARVLIHQQSVLAYRALAEAFAVQGNSPLTAFGWPGREVRVGVQPDMVWGISAGQIPDPPMVNRALDVRGVPPGSAGPATLQSAEAFETLARVLLESASRELLLRRLGEALAQTSRQVNVLDKRLAPRLSGQLRELQRALGEREREERVRQLRMAKRKKERRVAASAWHHSREAGRVSVNN